VFRKLLIAAVGSLLASTAAQAGWYQASSKHFVVYANDSLTNVKDFTERLERFDKAIRVWHVAPEDPRGPSARVTIFVVNDVSDIQRLYGSGGDGVAGFYHPVAGESVAFTPRSGGAGDLSSRAILFHEYTHHWMLTNWTDAALPPWFVEGFAELHATALFRNNSVIFGAVPTYRRYTVGNMNVLPMNRLLRFDPGIQSDEERDALYSHGWALSHYLTFDPERRKQLAAYIGALNSGKAADASALIGNGADMDIKLASYVRRPSLPSAAFSYDQLPIAAVTVRPLTPGEAAVMPAMMLSKRAVDRKNAGKVAALTRSLATPFPNDAAAQNELAEAEFDACSVDAAADAACFARAEAAADRALAADPKSIHALDYKAMAQLAALKRAKVTDPARWTAARRWFLAANRIDTEAPQPLIGFYRSFLEAGQIPSASARAGLVYAYALAPYDAGVRKQAAEVLLGQGKLAEARIAIAPVAYSVEERDEAAGAQKVLARIDAGDTAGALEEFKRQAKQAAEEERKG